MEGLSDNDVMLRVKNGDLRKMDLLFRRYRDPLFAFVFRMTNRREASEDIVQNVFYRMIRSRHTFTGNGEFRTWMFHLARNVLKDHYKLDARHGNHADVDAYAERMEGGTLADSFIERKQGLELLQNALQHLNEEDREIIILSRFHELKYYEIARIMDTTVGAVKTRMHRAMHQLKAMLLKSRTNEM
ncbi:MAG: sigma-70 family RNA polymerase sigma factor [Bacteroidota bacterium]